MSVSCAVSCFHTRHTQRQTGEELFTRAPGDFFDCESVRGRVVVEAALTTNRDVVRLSVDDPGDGIPRDVVPHIFDPYARGRTDEHRGFGPGLYIVKRFADELGATVHVEGVPGAGTRFEITVLRSLVTAGARVAA